MQDNQSSYPKAKKCPWFGSTCIKNECAAYYEEVYTARGGKTYDADGKFLRERPDRDYVDGRCRAIRGTMNHPITLWSLPLEDFCSSPTTARKEE